MIFRLMAEPRVTADRAAEILAAANIGVKRMEGE